MELDLKWMQDHWAVLVLAVYMTRNFINNLLANCPFLAQNRVAEVVQGVFNAAVKTIAQGKTPQVETQPPNSTAP